MPNESAVLPIILGNYKSPERRRKMQTSFLGAHLTLYLSELIAREYPGHDIKDMEALDNRYYHIFIEASDKVLDLLEGKTNADSA